VQCGAVDDVEWAVLHGKDSISQYSLRDRARWPGRAEGVVSEQG
jgi:hypothetical protein